ncbi:high affinity cationic amino acid transporter 1-like [Euwallacea similis]|uniref:high affinity cationic amino acid transporter 1-like n=1 Tax=Euwallacea similis TaxID=1736056 RepID=UPI00344D5114
MAARIFRMLTRRKTDSDQGTSAMARCLNLIDLTALGVGATLGLGVYVLAGSVAKKYAGPAVCLSFLIAAVASAFAGVCYAEFASRVPKAGSAYVYSYVTVGEFIAFVIGWNLILEYIIGTASVARGLSNYIDALADKKISEAFQNAMPMHVSFLSTYPDMLSFVLVLILTAILAFGVKESSVLNNIFTVLNLITVAIVIIAGSIKADTNNWKLSKDVVGEGYGNGGFLPYGMAGVMTGAAKCFYGFVGFDAVATTGEEAKNPQKDIPLAIVISLFIIFSAYFGVSTVLTMMWPYYDQDEDAPFPYVFSKVGWITIKWIVTCGAVFALCTSLLGAMFPLPRVIYAMANDGIVFKPLGKVHKWTQTPLIATFISGILSGVMAMIFDLEQLIDMMSIGTLLAYTIVAICVLILRYQVDEDTTIKCFDKENKQHYEKTFLRGFIEIFNLHNNKEPNVRTSRIVNWSIAIFSVFAALFGALIINVPQAIFMDTFYLFGFVVSLTTVLALLVVMARQPTVDINLSFKVPLVPFIPCISVFFNIYLMLELDRYTWIRFVVWLIIGFLIYFCYGIRNSVEGEKFKAQQHQLTETIKTQEKKGSISNGSYSAYDPE